MTIWRKSGHFPPSMLAKPATSTGCLETPPPKNKSPRKPEMRQVLANLQPATLNLLGPLPSLADRKSKLKTLKSLS
ncbi:MAG TPA: hypothetical protein VNZ22_20000, partial [Bacillota bacterium]|nr:hypothetical protein [Bacillota bacterium]